MTTAPEYFIAALLRDYLTATQADTLDAAIPKILFDGGKVPEPLSIVIVAREAEDKKSNVRRLEVTVNLITWLKAADAAAAAVATQTTREAAASILQRLENRLRDDAAFNAFIADIADGADADSLDGWSIVSRRFDGIGSPMREADTHKMTYPIRLRYSLAVSREI
jgi:hypothetical protein